MLQTLHLGKNAMRILLFFIMFWAALPCSAQVSTDAGSEERQVLKTLEKLFDGMRTGDSALVHSVFAAEVQLFTSYQTKDGKSVLRKGDLQRFLEAVGTPHDRVWNEPVWDTQVRIDDNLAQVWTKYAFYAGNEFSHCGVDAFHLHKTAQGWKIFHLTDTRRIKPCEVPEEISKKIK